MERELTKKEIGRQDFVDNAVFNLLRDIAPANAEIEWDIETIAAVREAARMEIVNKKKLMTEQEFYPYIEI